MSIGILVLTKKALRSGLYLKDCLSTDKNVVIYAPIKLNTEDLKLKEAAIVFYEKKFSEMIAEIYSFHRELIFLMATGIVVRTIAPLLADKTSDPAIVVMDEDLKFAISLIGGHVAGANALANQLAQVVNGIAIITTATDVNQVSALDLIARDMQAYQNAQRDLYKKVNYSLAQGEQIFLVLDSFAQNEHIDTRGFSLIDHSSLKTDAAESVPCWMKDDSYLIEIGVTSSINDYFTAKNEKGRYGKIIPRKIVLGMGCKKNTQYEVIREVFDQFIRENHLEEKSIREIVSIDLKKDEKGLIQLATELQVKFKTYSAKEINDCIHQMDIFEKSEFVKSITGAPAVAEPCAFMASHGNLIIPRFAKNGVTIAAGYDYNTK